MESRYVQIGGKFEKCNINENNLINNGKIIFGDNYVFEHKIEPNNKFNRMIHKQGYLTIYDAQKDFQHRHKFF